MKRLLKSLEWVYPEASRQMLTLFYDGEEYLAIVFRQPNNRFVGTWMEVRMADHGDGQLSFTVIKPGDRIFQKSKGVRNEGYDEWKVIGTLHREPHLEHAEAKQ